MVLTKSELEIMDVLWEAGAPLSRADLLDSNREKSWKDSSVHILLNGLLAKGAIEEVGFVKRSKTYGRTFQPRMTREQYFAGMVYSFRNKPRLVELMEALLSRPDVTGEDLDRIEALIREKRI